ncbi:MAG: DUF1338 domain-containing protein [Bdellovibrionales bacterium]|nr:DUF1338 domain-containing protein [Bdellovibrionales bacterium]
MTIEALFSQLWNDYITLNPSAKQIHDFFVAEGESVVNDHVAFRTFRHPRTGVDQFAKAFEKLGYVAKEEYTFVEKKLFAKHYEHSNPAMPKVFISELKVNELSPFAQKTLSDLIEQIPAGWENREDFCVSGRPWNVSHRDYEELLKESEYAAWLSAFGFRANHFTVFINHLKKLSDINTLNSFIESKGYQLNASGGKVKGSKEVFLEQSSTKAVSAQVQFSDGKFQIPACYYEFAKRYEYKPGVLYQGFVEKSADKIFESTNTR